ncbi:hypothetical protein DFH08DRAFT_851184 [Mycena albidolilacea]|uniref:Uncharacterized protein n=1 Tax=Mycena albidolilacea TaxID=1033008 RepID=A0AAD7AFH1_9AGAR|nr:hypothetical protein DFH08DRAFT_851184 [Mycena albidolilacea]
MPHSGAESEPPEPTAPVSSLEESRAHEGFETISSAIDQIGRLELLDFETIMTDVTIHETISLASNRILSFLDCLDQQPLPADGLDHFGKLFDIAFLEILFEQRKIFHRIAVQSLAAEPGSSTAVVCWVDAILTKLGDATIPVASGVCLTPLFSGSAESRAEDGLRAATQLPPNWHSVAGVIASGHASPAAKRLALRLTFGAFVLGPSLCTKSDGMPYGILEVLDRCISQTRATGFSASRVGDQLAIQERLNFAMIVTLYATASRQHRNFDNASQLRPHSVGGLLNVVQHVLHPDDSVSSLQFAAPPEYLDPAQMVLLRWGDTVSWCWETWDDHRTANAESVIFLTSIWLRHSDVDHSFTVSTASSIAILRVLHQLVLSTISAGSLSMSLTSRACFFAVKSMKHWLWCPKEDERWIVSGFCKCLLSLFVLLAAENDEEVAVHDYILEALSFADADTLHICMAHVKEDNALRFAARLHERFVRVQNLVSGSLAQPQTLKLDLVRCTLSFAVIVWFSKTNGCLLREPVSSLLSNVTKILLQEGSPSLVSKILGHTILTASSAAKKDLPFADENREYLWQFATTSSAHELSIASSFAHYIITSELCDSLFCAEAWRYLAEVLLLILKHQYIDEQEPLALLTCPTLCGALIRLLQADAASTQFMLSTPFTLNLCADLKSVSEGNGSGEYFDLMRERLNKIGPCLLDQIRSNLSRSATADTPLEIPMRLVFYRHGVSHLIFVPDM